MATATKTPTRRKPRTKKKQATAETTTPQDNTIVVENSQAVQDAIQGLGFLFEVSASGIWKPDDINAQLKSLGYNFEVSERSWLNACKEACKKHTTRSGERYEVLSKGDIISIGRFDRTVDMDGRKAKKGEYEQIGLAHLDTTQGAQGWEIAEGDMTLVTMTTNQVKQHLYGGDMRYHVVYPILRDIKHLQAIGTLKYIPITETEKLGTLCRLLSALGISYRCYSLEPDVETKKSLAEDIKLGIQKQFEDLKERWTNQSSRKDSVEKTKAEAQEILSNLAMLNNMLGQQMSEVEAFAKEVYTKADQIEGPRKGKLSTDEIDELLANPDKASEFGLKDGPLPTYLSSYLLAKSKLGHVSGGSLHLIDIGTQAPF